MDHINKVIVVGGNHYNTLWVCRSLSEAGYNCDVILLDAHSQKCFIGKSNSISKLTIVHDSQSLIELLIESGNLSLRKVLLCSSDQVAEIIDNNLNKLSAFYVIPNCGNKENNLVKWMDKRNMLELAKNIGLNVANSIFIDIKNPSLIDFSKINYPCLLKPEISSKASKNNFRICKNESDLQFALKTLEQNCLNVIIQDYIQPDFEITACGVHYKNRNIIPGAVNKHFTCKSLSSLGMHCLSCVLDNFDTLVNRSLVDKFLNELDYQGPYSIEFIIKNNKAYFLEINLRTDGTIYQNTTAGVNLPAIWVDFCLTGNTKNPTTFNHIPTWGMCEFSYLKNITRRNPMQIIRDWWKTDCYSIFSWKDPLPFIYKFIYAL